MKMPSFASSALGSVVRNRETSCGPDIGFDFVPSVAVEDRPDAAKA
jgi:hypothetical protein